MNKINEFLVKAKNKYGDKYDYSLVKYINSKIKVKIICPYHGEFMQTPDIHLNKNAGCPFCKNRAINNESFIKKSKIVHKNKYDYSKSIYKNNKTKVKIICPYHGEFYQLPSNHLNGAGCKLCKNTKRLEIEDFVRLANKIHKNKYNYNNLNYKTTHDYITINCPLHGDFNQRVMNHVYQSQGCPVCARRTSNEEQEILEFIEQKYSGKIFNSCRNIIPPFELDIYLPELKIAIEYNGLFWHGEEYKKMNYHLNKLNMCQNKNIRLIQINSNMWNYKNELIKEILNRFIGKCKNKIYARNCEVKIIDNLIAKEFCLKNHIQGFNHASTHLGLYNEGKLISYMSFGKSRFNKNYQWELIRYCSLKNFIVIGGANKLFQKFLKIKNPKSIISYCDISIFSGKIYKNLGFKFSHRSSPNYWYFKKGVDNILLSRVQFQKHKLKNKLEKFDPNLTEWENMKANNWDRYWDCGNDVYIFIHK